MTTPINTATRWGQLAVRGLRRNRPDANKIAEVLVELAREEMAGKRSRDDRTAISGEGSPVSPRRTRQLDQDRIRILVRDYMAGATICELAARFGVDRRTVSAILHRHEVPIRRPAVIA
jgi:DNA invertase Pin-like site-specific DNA recombinase